MASRNTTGATAPDPNAPPSGLTETDQASGTSTNAAPGQAGGPDPVVMTRGDAATGTGPLNDAAGAPLRPAAEIPVQIPGPGAGALNIVEPAMRYETRPLDQESRDPRAPAPGSRLPAFARAGILDTARAVVDASLVQGQRIVMAAATILHDGEEYVAGDRFPVSFKTYAELVEIGAVVADRWSDLERVPDPDPAPADKA